MSCEGVVKRETEGSIEQDEVSFFGQDFYIFIIILIFSNLGSGFLNFINPIIIWKVGNIFQPNYVFGFFLIKQLWSQYVDGNWIFNLKRRI